MQMSRYTARRIFIIRPGNSTSGQTYTLQYSGLMKPTPEDVGALSVWREAKRSVRRGTDNALGGNSVYSAITIQGLSGTVTAFWGFMPIMLLVSYIDNSGLLLCQ